MLVVHKPKKDGSGDYIHYTSVYSWDAAFSITQVGDIVFEQKTSLWYKRCGDSFVSTVSCSQ